jgi:hypothetical protein
MNYFIKQAACTLVTVCFCSTLIGIGSKSKYTSAADSAEAYAIKYGKNPADTRRPGERGEPRGYAATREELREMVAKHKAQFQKYLNSDRSFLLSEKEKNQLIQLFEFLEKSIRETKDEYMLVEANFNDFLKKLNLRAGGEISQSNPEYVWFVGTKQRLIDRLDNLVAGAKALSIGEVDPRLASMELEALMKKAAQTAGGVRGTLGSTGLAEKQLRGELVPAIVKKIEALSLDVVTPDEQEAEWARLGLSGNIDGIVKYIQNLANELMEMQQNKSKRINDELVVQKLEANLVFLLTFYQDFKMSPFSKKAIALTIAQLMNEGEDKKPTYDVASAPITVASRPFGTSERQQERPEFTTIQLKKSSERTPREPITTVRPMETARMQVQQRPTLQEMPATRPTAAPRNAAMPPIVQKVLMISPTQKTVDEQNTEWNRLKIRFAIKDRARYAKDLATELIRGQKNAQTRIDDRDLYNAVAQDLVILLDQYSNDRSVMNDASLNRLVRQALDQLRP